MAPGTRPTSEPSPGGGHSCYLPASQWKLPEATMPTIDLPIGPVDYRVVGPSTAEARVAVFVHGFLVNSTLWDPVAEMLAADGGRCILPCWPPGAHRRPA